jgi:hypothetical protein
MSGINIIACGKRSYSKKKNTGRVRKYKKKGGKITRRCYFCRPRDIKEGRRITPLKKSRKRKK